MIIYEVLYARCLRYNICSAWFLDIRLEYQLVSFKKAYYNFVAALSIESYNQIPKAFHKRQI